MLTKTKEREEESIERFKKVLSRENVHSLKHNAYISLAVFKLWKIILMSLQQKNPSLGGFEPPTFRLTAERASRLRHRDSVGGFR